ncbi:Tungstate uptake system ATP-binding protein TupC [Fundidesulfovibrio magnetotacticus]|uniref:Tungstate uptake system ATP-binding protein TupC n=1 Tax=Fundidesulfovibrio magnetotacticus TaxID=2730080 RepID=A0A6V8M0Y4_9BACT|nr:energy-coupling factor ABC transporter ATP-binding protein [Fundidesulfovibrio magnetotacticus]GFK95666.1 Tungstate uptake system ATP-binding protein TupC [Fundidesulfovibrio magnetotacticus]
MSLVYKVSGLRHAFSGRPALRCDALSVEAGSIVGIRGPNGAGKSTLLSILAFLLTPDEGQVLFLGRPGRVGDVALRRAAVLMPQDPALLRRRVEDNVVYGLKARGVPEGDAASQALDLVGLDPARYLRRWWWELSGGEARRVALASRLSLSPSVLLLDEPTASLDPESSGLVAQALGAARERRGLTAVIVSHDGEWLDACCDQVYRLSPPEGLQPAITENRPCAL